MQHPQPCVVCGAPSATLWRSREALATDLRDTAAAGHRLLLADAVDVHRCGACGSLFRDPDAVPADLVDRYRDDPYPESELVRLHHSGRAAHERERDRLARQGLRPGGRILEVGSYAGALLAVARGVGCAAVGVDVGRATSGFARSLDLDVVTGALEPDLFRFSRFDAVFVHNCFEQLPEPEHVLATVHRLLPAGGSLVIRTPDADYASRAHDPDRRSVARAEGVLGLPFVRCFSARALRSRLRGAGFAIAEIRGRGTPWMEVTARAA